VANYFDGGEFPLQLEDQGLRKGRSIRDGYARGWGLEFGNIRNSILDDPIYQSAAALAEGRTIQAENCRMNLFLLAKYFLPKILDRAAGGSIVEFGSFRGGSAIFLAAVVRSLDLNVKVYGLDTFEGMPPVDKGVDAHNTGDFAGVDLKELNAFVQKSGLAEHLEFVRGVFEATAPELLVRIPPVLLAHIDCDVYNSVAYAWDAVKPFMADGGYVAFDDAAASSCLGATEAVEDLAIRRDGLNCEQIWPHFVFRLWQTDEPAGHAEEPPTSRTLLSPAPATGAQQHQLQAARAEASRLRGQYNELSHKLIAAQSDVRDLDGRLAEAQSRLGTLNSSYSTLRQQVLMAEESRWVRLGRLFGIGPKFTPPE